MLLSLLCFRVWLLKLILIISKLIVKKLNFKFLAVNFTNQYGEHQSASQHKKAMQCLGKNYTVQFGIYI